MEVKGFEIHIPAKKYVPNEQRVIKLTAPAAEALADVVNESGRSVKEVASLIILQAIEKGTIVFDREE